METETGNKSTGKVKADNARIDRLKERLRSTPQELDFERIRIMKEVYEETAGDVQILRRAKFLAALLDGRRFSSTTTSLSAPWQADSTASTPIPNGTSIWMREEKTVEKSPTPEDKKANHGRSNTGTSVG